MATRGGVALAWRRVVLPSHAAVLPGAALEVQARSQIHNACAAVIERIEEDKKLNVALLRRLRRRFARTAEHGREGTLSLGGFTEVMRVSPAQAFTPPPPPVPPSTLTAMTDVLCSGIVPDAVGRGRGDLVQRL